VYFSSPSAPCRLTIVRVCSISAAHTPSPTAPVYPSPCGAEPPGAGPGGCAVCSKEIRP
jgi:hypothetical protein